MKSVYGELVTKVNAVDSSKLVKNTDYDTKIKEIGDKIPNHYKYITTPEFNKFTKENVDDRFKQTIFTSKNGTDDFIKKQILVIK